MGAIAGILYFDSRPVARDTLAQMLQRQAHRGPDGQGMWANGSAGLGACHFRATPQSHFETQPIVDPHRGLVLVADARLDNREELIAALSDRGDQSARFGDAKLLLLAWDRWAERSLEHLLGDFAFALWDKRRRLLFCARDHAGVRPFYYYASAHFLAFASEIKALFALPDVPRRLNEVKVADYLAEHFEDRAITFYQGIQRLPPAHSLRAADRSVHIQRYWNFDLARDLPYRKDEDTIAAFRELFIESVRCRLRADGPVGTQLSGGLDSSSITCVARQACADHQHHPLHAYSAVFPTLAAEDPQIDERGYIDCVSRLNGLVHHPIHADRISPLIEQLWSMDEWVVVPNVYMDWGIYSAAKDAKIRIILSGHDGDVVVSYGYHYLPYLVRKGRWMKFLREARDLCRKKGWRPKRVIWKMGIQPALSDPAIGLMRLVRGTGNHSRNLSNSGVSNPEFMRRVGQAERLAEHDAAENKRKFRFREQHALVMPGGLDLYGLEFFNHLGALLSVEPRFPFYDRRLMEFCLAVHPGLKLRHGQTRWIFRKAMEGILPDPIVNRMDKGDLSANFCKRLLGDGREMIEEALYGNHQLIGEYIDLHRAREDYRKYRLNPMDSRSKAPMNVYIAVSFYLWLRANQLSA